MYDISSLRVNKISRLAALALLIRIYLAPAKIKEKSSNICNLI